MKRLLSVLVLAGAFCFGTAMPVVAQDKAADKPAVEAPAAKTDEKKDAEPAKAEEKKDATPAAAEAAAPTPKCGDKGFDCNKGDVAWMMTSTAFVLLMTVPGLALF